MNTNINKLYDIYIYERYRDLKKSKKIHFDNNDLCKIFEYYSCINLTNTFKQQFYEYNDIEPDFKELHNMSKNDTGIDLSNKIDTIVQCKLRKKYLNWKECGTFFASQNIFDKILNKHVIKWNKLIITRNSECDLSKNLQDKKDMFVDIKYSKKELLDYCENLLLHPPEYNHNVKDFKLRKYQQKCIDLISKNDKNIIIQLPTGTGKNCIIIYSLMPNKKYLILVPRIILLEQIYDEILKHKPEYKNNIQMIGDNNDKYNDNINITICVFNSIKHVNAFKFDKIFVDEAHHINKPMIYNYDDEEVDLEDNIKYLKLISNLKINNNNVYLSATIDENKDFLYFKQDLRKMIDKKFLCDYTINIPIFNTDPTNKNICSYLLKNYRNIIIYCNTQEEGIQINTLLNTLRMHSSAYIDCNTNKSNRNKIINKFKKGEINFLVNVRILVEGFDAPITKGICFMHLPKSKTTIIQIIGRALRKHNDKKIAQIILPFSCSEDEDNINNFLKIIANNDPKIKNSFVNKKIGGYININKVDNIKIEEIMFRYEMIYNSLGVLINRNEI